MDFVCLKDDLVFGVKLASYALGTRSSMPILAGIKMEIEGDALRIYATDLERAIHCELPIENRAGNESVVLNGAVLSRIASRLPADNRISLRTGSEDGTLVKLQCGESSFDLLTLPVEDYPDVAPLPQSKIGTLDVGLFHRGIEQTVFAALRAGETTRLNLTGVNMVLKQGSLKLVATNGYRLSLKEIAADEVLAEQEYLIDASVLTDLDRVLSQLDSDKVHLHKGEGEVFFHTGGVTFMAKTIAEEFPDFEQVIPQDNQIGLFFERRALLETLQRIEITAAEESGAATIQVSSEESAVRINSSSADKGEAMERVRLKKVPSQDIEVSFKAEYLIDALKRMNSDEVVLWLTDSEKAGLFEPYGENIPQEDQGFLYVCMPVRISGRSND
ncbi:MAG: DNA polymerase III subunit beta [Candidatus Bipolaricaulota bacterium]|nr:DNA polymerase III subunit beta [Candidatus Bipolaricaulota bacterium]